MTMRMIPMLACLLLFGCLKAPETPPSTIRVAINSDIRSTNPGVLRDGNTDTVLYHIGEGLVAYRDDMTVGPMLAEKISLSSDRKTYSFTLRRGVQFHNGATMTSREVLWSWRRLLDPETGFRCLDDFDGTGASGVRIEKIEAHGPHKVVFTLNKPSALFLDRMASVQCQTSILHPDSVSPDGTWINPVGTGPYRLKKWRRGRSVTLTRFDDYSARSDKMSGLTGKKTAYAREVRFIVTPDRAAAKASLYAGALDLVFAAPLSAYEEMKHRAKNRGDVRLHRQSTLDWTVLLMQTRDSLLSDVRMRRAIAHALSPEIIASISTYDLAPVNSSPVTRASRFRTPADDEWISYDPDKARRLAHEAGYAGEVITIQCNRKFSYMYENAVAAQAMLAAAGFNVKIEVFDWATQLSNFQRGDFQLSSFGYSSRSHPALLFATFTGSKEVRQSYQWENPKALRLVGAFENARDDSTMQMLLERLQQLMVRDVPLIGLYNDEIIDLTSTRLIGYQPWSIGRPRLWNVKVAEEKTQ